MIKKENYWPIGLSVIILTFLLFFAGFFVFSRINRVHLVEEDYYKKELAYQDQIERIQRSQKFSETVSLNLDTSSKKVKLRFPKEIDPIGVTGNIMFFRPSDARQDKLIPIELSLEHEQLIDVAKLPKGRWKVKIFWVLDNSEYYDEIELYLN